MQCRNICNYFYLLPRGGIHIQDPSIIDSVAIIVSTTKDKQLGLGRTGIFSAEIRVYDGTGSMDRASLRPGHMRSDRNIGPTPVLRNKCNGIATQNEIGSILHFNQCAQK